jgi:hypothetical protein
MKGIKTIDEIENAPSISYDQILERELRRYGLEHFYSGERTFPWERKIVVDTHTIERPEKWRFLGIFPIKSYKLVAQITSESALARDSEGHRNTLLRYDGLSIKVADVVERENINAVAERLGAILEEKVEIA